MIIKNLRSAITSVDSIWIRFHNYLKHMVYSAVARLVGIIAQNILLCDSSDNTGWRGGRWRYTFLLWPALHAGKEWPCVLFLSFARALGDFPANVLLLFYNSTSWNSPPTSHQMLH